MTSSQPILHDNLRLHTTQTHYYIESLFSDNKEILIIDRVTQELSLSRNAEDLPQSVSIKSICGIFGIIRLLAGPYLIVITKKVKVGELDGQVVWRVDDTEVLPYCRTTMHLNEHQKQDNLKYLSMIETVLSMEGYYFSTSYDITHSVQRLHNTSPDFKSIPFHDRADARFLWNSFILRDLSQQSELASFTLPVMLGFVSVVDCNVNGHAFKYAIVSRRCCHRAGTRYNTRGIDAEGNVANYVETEQIIELSDAKCAFVQTRGSVPLYWKQDPNLKYKPLPVITCKEDHFSAFQRHFAAQFFNYGKQVIVNLLDQKQPELQLVQSLGDLTTKHNHESLKLVAFDFHKECRKMQWHRLDILIDLISQHQKDFEYFSLYKDDARSLQSGVFRTNCIDCLDRTNVVQSMIAKRSLLMQLRSLSIISDSEGIENFKSFESTFRNTWADNADTLAKQYAGTGALKTDFTRTGKRTVMGALVDGYNSVKRYLLNNFYDGFKQDSQDLFLGNYEVDENECVTLPSALRQDSDWKFYAFPAIFLVAFSMCVVSILIPDEHASEQFMYVAFWGSASAATMAMMIIYGREFVDKPKLVTRKLKIE